MNSIAAIMILVPKDRKVNLTTIAHNLKWYNNVKDDLERKHWKDVALDFIDKECSKLPHGSGLDSGVQFDLDKSRPQRLVFKTAFHHMDDNGMYDGWTEHYILIKPVFGGYVLSITGRDKRQIKEYLYQLFYEVFTV